ncbi:sarcoplasmic reticulum glycoprotein, putative,sarcalumenin precursor, putative [Trypanosoma cruzi]|uniref:Sarcoplasmic reticulum glycoprotein n=2 Tax=Trypanosoma cruzi TaxID=5693 RepID=V5BSA9_TRYCR|nr:sarcoplasmic reticulum glycoprotein, putative,sarcalumenin precursor, putative [Trypanosoma cruzi]ESS70749.1 sarcoplasmic reticulum glycoprotein [Trypanosoma cruzi Dm28c]PBJ70183.1 sarcoplasmic reticulum glycoprotein,sarcalumenin [Trypanosoma cruzi cruzi]KAF8282447.1 putative Sarcalumenin [Trypanosoma cruzi]PWV01426.1 putative Sarcalumenin [Trypanosoma cruzi]
MSSTEVKTATESVAMEPEGLNELIEVLHTNYLKCVKPVEDMYKYDLFRPSWFEETILNQKPFVTFFGPWSSGKSTFINHLLQDNYLWTGPQPTTAEFTVVLYGEEVGPVSGHVLASAKNLPFKGLTEFGESFLGKFQGYRVPHELLKRVTLIDTPGILESVKDIRERQFDYVKVSRWFAERSDLIFILFDPSKLDAGIELKMMFKHAFRGMEGKVRIVLNKADSINTQELMRVYGSIFWNLSNLINCTEPPRVYVGSFWDQPYKKGAFTLLFTEEKTDLLHEIVDVLPQQARDKKVASLIRRAKEVLVHALIVGGMRSDLPLLFGKEKAKRKAIDNLQKTYEIMAAKYKMNWKDFPPVEEYRTFLEKFDLEKFPEIEKAEKDGKIGALQKCIETTLPSMLRPVKSTTAADPRDKAQREKLQQMYLKSIRSQYEGKVGKQGSSDVVQSSHRESAVTSSGGEGGNASTAPQQTTDPMTVTNSSSMPDQAQMFMGMMMQMMQQQQQQQQQRQQEQRHFVVEPVDEDNVD